MPTVSCSSQNTHALELKLSLKEKELKEIKIDFQKEKTSLISNKQNLERDEMLKDLNLENNNALKNI